jgi:hypothetical protein
MVARRLCLGLLLLWLTTAAIAAWVLVNGWTAPGRDGRTEVRLAPAERALVLGEMRQLLKALHGVVTGLGEPESDRRQAEQAARAAGMGMAADVEPALMAKLPLAFKQMGMSVHRDFDGLADGIAAGESEGEILRRLASITARCTTCHDLYQLPSPGGAP